MRLHRRVLGAGLMALFMLVAGTQAAPAAPASGAGGGKAMYEALRTSGAIDDYLADVAQEVLDRLVRASGAWTGSQVNGPHRPGSINLYLVNSDRLSDRNAFAGLETGLRFDRDNLLRNALTDEASGTLFVDTRLLKEFVAVSVLRLGDGAPDTITILAQLRTEDLDRTRRLWDPAANPLLRERGATVQWLVLYRGMLGFLLGHELGHVRQGSPTAEGLARSQPYASAQERDLHWACPSAVDPAYARKRDSEAAADRFAVELIAAIPFPPGATPRPRYWYELGAHQYVVFSLYGEMLTAAQETPSDRIRGYVRMNIGPQLFDRLIEAGAPRPGSVQVFFPKDHPATYSRATEALALLARSPVSFFYGEGSDSDIALLESLRQQACSELLQKYGLPSARGRR